MPLQGGETVARIYRPDIAARMLDRVKPDFVQCDTKGHPGLSSYPTKIGTPAYKIKEDILKMWRSLTAERDIALYGHHSGLYDMQAAKQHPEWAIVDENGTVSDKYLSPFSPYADQILIPQLKELALNYKLNGAWIDGECWATFVDYGSYATDAYMKETGKKPEKSFEKGYERFREFCRRGFLTYVQHYIDELKRAAPDFQITSNWIFSAYMPVEPTVSVDFLSGDYSSVNSVASARHQGRCLLARGMTWDLMSWGHNAKPEIWTTRNRTTKEYVQYCQEASQIIAMGGAFEFFNIVYGGGGCIQEWAIDTWEKVAAFVREREQICFQSNPLHEIAVLYPEENLPPETKSLYTPWSDSFLSACSWIDAIQNTQHSCEIIYEYQLLPSVLSQYKLLIVPNSNLMKKTSVERILGYVKSGGKVICDINANKYFTSYINVKERYTAKKLIFVDGGKALASLETLTAAYESVNAEICGVYYDDNIYDHDPHPAAILSKYGRGKIINMCFDFSTSYRDNISTALEKFFINQLKAINYAPMIKVRNNPFVDVIPMCKNGKWIINLINYSGNHALENVRTYSAIPPLYHIDIAVSTKKAPKCVYLEPEHKKLDFQFINQKTHFTVDKIDIHKIIVIEK